MKKLLLVFLGLIIINPTQLIAGDKEDIIKQLLSNNAYAKKNNQTADEYSSKGALEFWSSGGLMQTIEPSGRPEKDQVVVLSEEAVGMYQVAVLEAGSASASGATSEAVANLSVLLLPLLLKV